MCTPNTPSKGWWFKGVDRDRRGTGTAAPAPSAPAAQAAGGPRSSPFLNPTNNQNVSTKSDYTSTARSTIQAISIGSKRGINGERQLALRPRCWAPRTPNKDGSCRKPLPPTHFPSTHSNLYIYAHKTPRRAWKTVKKRRDQTSSNK